jgi:hypothetical protein
MDLLYYLLLMTGQITLEEFTLADIDGDDVIDIDANNVAGETI